MTRGRTLVVTALTAVLAASYVAVAQPAGAELSETTTSSTSATSSAPAHPTRHPPTTTAAAAGGTMSVGVPVVALAARITAGSRGALRTPVLLADPTVTGHASVWPGDRCGVDLVHGVVSWIVCDVRPGSRIRVILNDGRVYVRPIR